MEAKGRIFDIQRYSIHDGDGIRTLVFFKGCFLRCKWCCNPESQSGDTEIMTINNRSQTAGRDVTVADVMAVVERDMPYYRRSGGGLTLSGGEVLFQPDFARDLLQAAKSIGLHTAIESSAMAPYETIKKIMPYLDLFLLDIKHTDSAKHKEYTGKNNELILENAKAIAESGMRLIIRVPVIPGFNATQAEISSIAAFAGTLPGVREIHLLPYHPYGEGKYGALGRQYLLSGIKAPDDKEMEQLKKAAAQSGLICKIGG